MATEADLGFWVSVWLLTALYLMARHWRSGIGSGLMFSYVLSFGALHWFGPVLHLLPWYDVPDVVVTVEGLRLAALALVALAGGAELAAWLTRHSAAEARDRDPVPVDNRVVNMYFLAGVLLYVLVTPLASRVASLTAFVSTGALLVVAGIGLHCWNAWLRGQRLRLWLWLLVASAWPVVTLVGEGFLGFGLAFLLMILAFVASFYQPRWRVVVAGVLVAYVGLSVYVTYMRDRRVIRSVVWSQAAVAERLAQVSDTFGNFEWFDIGRVEHLDRVELRLNQDFLLGVSAFYLQSRPNEFANGETFRDAVFALIPRAIWPDKPVIGGSGDLVARYTGLRFATGTSVGVGQVMEAYINRGVDAVIVVFVLLGAILVVVDRSSYRRLQVGDSSGFIVWYLPGLCLLQIGGSLSEMVAAAGAAFVMAFGLNRVAIYRRWSKMGVPEVVIDADGTVHDEGVHPLSHPALGVVTLDRAGGGVALVGRLLQQALESRWSDGCELFALTPVAREGRIDSSTADRFRFGTSLALAQASRRVSWVLYNHLAVAQVQAYVPPPLSRPYAVFLHGIEVWRPLRRLHRLVLRNAALRLANSTYTAQRVEQLHPDIGAVRACPLALPAAETLTAASDPDIPDIGPKAVIIVARMMAGERYKGHDALLAAWPRVLQRHPTARLVFVGGGDDVDRLRELARETGLGGAVVFTGFVQEAALRSIYERAKVFVMPSRGEGFGLAYLEAMSHGLPCIGSTHDAAGEVIADGVTGYLVPQDDHVALADRIDTLLADPGRARAIGEAGRTRVRERFSREAFTGRVLGLLDEAFVPTPARGAGVAHRTAT